MLGEIVTAGELLAALVALEWLVMGMERSVVTLEVFLAAEAAVAELADEGLTWVFSQGLLATSTVDELLWGRALGIVDAHVGCV